MLGFFEKRKWKRRLYSVPVLVALFGLAIFLSIEAYQAYTKSSITSERLDQQTARLEALTEREEELAAEVERLSTERGIERQIREKYDVGRDGEGVIVIVDQTANAQSAAMAEEPRNFWQRVRNLLPF